MARKRCLYTDVGKRIAALAKDQTELGRILGVSKQSISLKLRGENALFVSDLEKLASHYGVPLTYFVEDPHKSPELTPCWKRLRRMSPEAHEIVCIASKLPAPDVRKLTKFVKVIVENRGKKRGRSRSPTTS